MRKVLMLKGEEQSAAPILHDAQASVARKLVGVDLFAGAGGFSLAARRCDINIVAAVELDKHACTTYRKNIISDEVPKLYEENIMDLDPVTISQEHFGSKGACDLLLGGPPCQGFSVHRINGSGVDDPRNELVLRYFEYVKTLRPKIFLMENVPGILWPRHKFFLESLYSKGCAEGYRIFPPALIDARDFGVPQRRKRVFILGVRDDVHLDIDWPPEPTHGNESTLLKNPCLLPWRKADEVFQKPIPLSDKNNIHMNHSEELIKAFKNTPINGGSRKDSGRLLPCHHKHDGHKDVYGRIDPQQPAPTMTTACINPSKGRFVHPVDNHGITLRHAARFQTFPDDYVFYGGLIAGGVQVGNAVPVELGEALLKVISKALLSIRI
ncbi:DNA cytosine methyltransferase [Pseudomonas viridiflava]|uniref:DNA cytosine methyltransferase n=1 Tax=Pseudomonas viridiflava TaxID=33069 RepID=UPI001F119B4B|nr:DNA cytosine methyltransferase [Pseudomonas viridiflava]